MDDSNRPAPPKHDILGLLGRRLRGYFFAGILVTAPISITFFIAWRFIIMIDRAIDPLIPPAWNPNHLSIPGFGLVVVVVTLTLVGALMAGVLGRLWFRLSEAILGRMPVLRGIYSTLKQIFETVLAQKSQAFREVVLIEYPRRGIWTLAFITGPALPSIVDLAGRDTMVNVFVPTTPNPTSGFLLFLPNEDIHRLDLSVEDGLKLVISGGIVAPGVHPPTASVSQNAES